MTFAKKALGFLDEAVVPHLGGDEVDEVCREEDLFYLSEGGVVPPAAEDS